MVASSHLIWNFTKQPISHFPPQLCQNYMPLLRGAMYAKGVEIYCAPTADSRDTWTSTMQHVGCEGRCFVISANQFCQRQDFPQDYPAYEDLKPEDVITRGGSLIVGPLGETLAGPLYDQRGILTAVVKRSQLAEARFDFDPTGHYSRPDIFSLTVDQESKEPVQFR